MIKILITELDGINLYESTNYQFVKHVQLLNKSIIKDIASLSRFDFIVVS